MQPIRLLAACLVSSIVPLLGIFQDAPKPVPPPPAIKAEPEKAPSDEPELVITPNTIRIQSMAKPEEGHWVTMPGFSELGSPSFSRDGQWIAFDAYRMGYNNSPSECWIVRRDGKNLTKLAVGATPRWSPDGKRLLFMRDEANDRRRQPGIFVIDRDGTNERRIGDGRWADWSPDGKEIAFSMGGLPGPGLREGATTWLSKADGTGRREIGDGDCPSWSPDGTKIVCCVKFPDRPPLLVVHDLKTGEAKGLGYGWYRANWLPDGKSVVSNGPIGRKITMVRLSLNAPGRPVEVPTEFEEPFSPCCSSDGKEIVFIARKPKPAPQ